MRKGKAITDNLDLLIERMCRYANNLPEGEGKLLLTVAIDRLNSLSVICCLLGVVDASCAEDAVEELVSPE